MARSILFFAAYVSAVALVHCGSEEAHELNAPPPFTPSSGGANIVAPRNDAGAPAPLTTAHDASAPTTDGGKPPVSQPPATPTTTPTTPPAPTGTTPNQPPQTDPCANVQCGPNQACVPYAHGSPLGVCVDTCDCSNCGNCGGDNSDGRWSDMQEYCGAAPNQSPATKTCNRGCGGGAGCIPFGSVSICWPLEGCFSL